MRGISRAGATALVGAVLLPITVAGCGGSAHPTSAHPTSAHPTSAHPTSGPSTAGPTTAVQVAGKRLGSFTLPNGPKLIASRERHPRGGSQLHLYLARTGTELTDAEGGAVVPFVATDTPATLHVSTGCGPGILIVRTATVAGADSGRWTVAEQRYRVTGSGASPASSRVLARRVPSGQLAHRYPDIVHGSLLMGCAE